MSAFSASWLAEREPADARARRPELVAVLPKAPSAIVDLGTGTGSNLRWLAPRLGRGQKWILVDHDPVLLASVRRKLGDWATESGYEFSETDDDCRISGSGFDLSLGIVALDLASGLEALDLPIGGLVTASALLDLVSRDWLEALVSQIVASRSSALFALSFDGRVSFEPTLDDDAAIVSLLNRHQLTDKGFGPALGPDGWRTAAGLFEASGFDVRVAESEWQCNADDGAMLQTLIDGWVDCAVSMAPGRKPALRNWHRQRRHQIEHGGIRVLVGHRDVAAVHPEQT